MRSTSVRTKRPARAMVALAQGLVARIAVLGATPQAMDKALTDGVRALVSTRDPAPDSHSSVNVPETRRN
ncbi:hypothetical protein [Streptomyces acidiscabies]|uniref:hypothetical protein n=1 Tax=Streptomyces acidiscabies TaxID=42234 RepID=UPI0038F6239A